MTGQYKPALRYALQVLKDGNRILTEPKDIIAKCHRSSLDHHAGSLPQPAAATSNNKQDTMQSTCYPWAGFAAAWGGQHLGLVLGAAASVAVHLPAQ